MAPFSGQRVRATHVFSEIEWDAAVGDGAASSSQDRASSSTTLLIEAIGVGVLDSDSWRVPSTCSALPQATRCSARMRRSYGPSSRSPGLAPCWVSASSALRQALGAAEPGL
jgi:hypothetical protein